MKSKKSIVILTTFFDADNMIENGCFFYQSENKKDVVYKINLLNDKNGNPENYVVNSISLVDPMLKSLINVKELNRIDCFCPTYNIEKKYKEDHDWETYRKKYSELLKKRKTEIKSWSDSLEPDKVYLICCWENTKKISRCHREIIYSALKNSKSIKDRVLVIYRDGECNNKDEEIIYGICKERVKQYKNKKYNQNHKCYLDIKKKNRWWNT